jgi:hypothetical protein
MSDPEFGSFAWALHAAGFIREAEAQNEQPQPTCRNVLASGRHSYVIDLDKGDTVPRCYCGEVFTEAESESPQPLASEPR